MEKNDSVYFISYLDGREGDVYHYPLHGKVKTVFPEMVGLSTSGLVETTDGKTFHVKSQFIFSDESIAKEKLKEVLEKQKKEMERKKENVEKEIFAISSFLSLSSPLPGERFKTTVHNYCWP